MGACLRPQKTDFDGETAMISRYQGEKNCLGQRHGYGSYLFNNGDLYEGCWKFNKMHGYGVYTFSSGQKRDGFFENGKFTGKHSAEPPTLSSGEHVVPTPFPQTVRDEEEQAERRRKREERRAERERRHKERQKKLEEMYKKYQVGKRVKKYGATEGS